MFLLCFRALSTQQGGYVHTTNLYYYDYYLYRVNLIILSHCCHHISSTVLLKKEHSLYFVSSLQII